MRSCWNRVILHIVIYIKSYKFIKKQQLRGIDIISKVGGGTDGMSSVILSIQFKIICIALFTIQSLQSNFTGNYVSKIDLYCRNSILLIYGYN